MKASLLLTAIAVLFALAAPAHAISVVPVDPYINPIVTATNSTVNDPAPIEVSFGTNLSDPFLAGWSVTVESVDIDFGDSSGVTTHFAWTGDPFLTTHVYGIGGTSYSVTAFLNGYFTDPSNVQHFFAGVGNGTSIFIAGFSSTPIPPSLLLFLTALGGLGVLGARRRKMALAAA